MGGNADEFKTELKYPFIEYMSYKLKQYGKQGLPYLNILEKEVNKRGITISDAIKKEHFDIAVRKSITWKQHNKHKSNIKSGFFKSV
jgi:hypothetical protein